MLCFLIGKKNLTIVKINSGQRIVFLDNRGKKERIKRAKQRLNTKPNVMSVHVSESTHKTKKNLAKLEI